MHKGDRGLGGVIVCTGVMVRIRGDCTYAQGSWRCDCVHRGDGTHRGLGGVIVCTGVMVRTGVLEG